MFLSKLRDDDSFGLVQFTDISKTLIQCDLKKNLELDTIFTIVDNLQSFGGTVLSTGFNEGSSNLLRFLEKNAKDTQAQNRIILLTDVNDNFGPCGPILQSISESNINTTIIGISEDFQSKTCEALKKVRGFNYFCAVEIDDLKHYLFDNFDYTFFPCLNDVQIRLKSDNIKVFDVFGTPDNQEVFENNNFSQKGTNEYLITKIPTLFPS